MPRMGYRAAIRFAALNGETLASAYAGDTTEETLENAAADVMVFTVAEIFGKDGKSVARAIIRQQERLN